MDRHKGKPFMDKTELQELLHLKGWSRTKLAAELDISENAVQKWFMAGRVPGGPATILLREWLAVARKEAEEHHAHAG